MNGARTALAFLTRLPGGSADADAEAGLARAVPWFPVVGGVVGASGGVVYLVSLEVVAPPVAALLAVALAALITGGLHEDGLADTFDSFGGSSAARRLEIMRDSRIGTYGVLALLFAIGFKVSSLSSLGAVDGLVAMTIAHGAGRGAAMTGLAAVPMARAEGLGAAFALDIGRGRVVLMAAAGAGLLGSLGLPGAVSLAATVVVTVFVFAAARRGLGGITGDVLGAAEQFVEVAVLIALSATVPTHPWHW